METLVRLLKEQNELGTTPANMLLETLISSIFFMPAIFLGMQPESSLWDNTISSRVSSILPMLLGMQPMNLLFANTITEAVEFPKFSGRTPWNLLLLTRMASRSLSKSAGGREPSKSLYLRSRYLSSGTSKTTLGNGPTKRLLLRSSS